MEIIFSEEGTKHAFLFLFLSVVRCDNILFNLLILLIIWNYSITKFSDQCRELVILRLQVWIQSMSGIYETIAKYFMPFHLAVSDLQKGAAKVKQQLLINTHKEYQPYFVQF